MWCPELGLVCPLVSLREHWMNVDEILYEHPANRRDNCRIEKTTWRIHELKRWKRRSMYDLEKIYISRFMK